MQINDTQKKLREGARALDSRFCKGLEELILCVRSLVSEPRPDSQPRFRGKERQEERLFQLQQGLLRLEALERRLSGELLAYSHVTEEAREACFASLSDPLTEAFLEERRLREHRAQHLLLEALPELRLALCRDAGLSEEERAMPDSSVICGAFVAECQKTVCEFS